MPPFVTFSIRILLLRSTQANSPNCILFVFLKALSAILKLVNLLSLKEIAILVKSSIVEIIVHHHIDSVVFVPPTVPRAVQFMKVLETELALSIAKVNVIKVIGDIRVPQKTLKKLADRVENAQHTFMVDNMAKFKTTLIIDDAVGSGASINQIACKLKHAKHTNKVIGFAITGSLHDFEVISEV